MSTPSENNILICPVRIRDDALFKLIRRKIEKVFGCVAEVTELLDDVNFSYDPARDQYHSTRILAYLKKAAPDHALKIVAITDVDLYIPILTYVYGEAQLSGRAAIVSTYRLNENHSPIVSNETARQRIVKETIHELGHTFGLRHCPEHACIMHYCRSIEDVDRKSDGFCRYCTVLLRDEKERLNILETGEA